MSGMNPDHPMVKAARVAMTADELRRVAELEAAIEAADDAVDAYLCNGYITLTVDEGREGRLDELLDAAVHLEHELLKLHMKAARRGGTA